VENQTIGGDVFFLLMGAILVFAMHGGFAFLEVGTVRRKNQVNALVKILTDFAVSITVYFIVGYWIAYQTGFFVSAGELVGGQEYGPQGVHLVKFFFLATFAAAIPAIVSGGIAERMKFLPQLAATGLLVALVYPLFEGLVWNGSFGLWFGFNVMSAQSLEAISGLVAMNSLLAMAGGIIAAIIAGRGDPGFVHNGALAGLVAVCAGSDVMHPAGSFVVGAAAGAIFVYGFELCQSRLKIDDVLGVWPLHGLCGLWGGVAAGVFGTTALGGLGGVSFLAQLAGSVAGAAYAFVAGLVVYALVDMAMGLRLSADDERLGADLAIHKVSANPEADILG